MARDQSPASLGRVGPASVIGQPSHCLSPFYRLIALSPYRPSVPPVCKFDR